MRQLLQLMIQWITLRGLLFGCCLSLSHDIFAMNHPESADICSQLTGEWHGTYQENTHLYGQSRPWPVTIHIQYNPHTQFFSGVANTPWIPSTVSETGKIQYISLQPARLLGICRQGNITKILLYTPITRCGHYTYPGGQLLNAKTLILHMDYEFSMNNAQFTAVLHRRTATTKSSNLSEPKTLFTINSCH